MYPNDGVLSGGLGLGVGVLPGGLDESHGPSLQHDKDPFWNLQAVPQPQRWSPQVRL